jgi:SAM-dependent methyltransferase
MADTIAPYLGERILEIGAGTGNLTRPLSNRKKYYAATDIGPEHLEALRSRFVHRSNVEVRECDVQIHDQVTYFQGRIDTVVCLNVLEHVPDPDAAARNIFDALPSGGRAIILVPQGQEIFGTLDVILGHFLRYSKDQLRARLEGAGFEVERIIEFNRVSRPGWYFTGKILKRNTLARFPLRMFNKLVWLWRKIDSSLPWGAVSIIAIARKR